MLMGWAVIFRFDVVLSMPAPAITLLAIGGLSYTIGGVKMCIRDSTTA